MARPADPERRAEILEGCFVAAQQCGRLELSLAHFAAETGVSARMLVYHFGSAEGLQLALAARLEEELRIQFASLEENVEDGGSAAAVLTLWDYVSAPEMRGLLRLLMDAVHRAQSGDTEAVRIAEREVHTWTEFLTARFSVEASSAIMLLFLGAGMDLLISGDPEIGRRALELVLKGVAADGAPGESRQVVG